MADQAGRTLGKYRLIERLGRGGMAEVYKAYQPRLDRYVAVKLMHAYLAEDTDFVGRFQREAKAIAALHHPHVVQVYDFDIEDDVYYMVQEYIEGGTLKGRLREASAQEKTIPIEETVRIFVDVCAAIQYAHEQGCVHRDVKPDNIMFDANDRPVLTDFGIAAIVGGTRLTATGAMVGTPAYMSPEQGKGEPGDARSDIYSLGVVLYEMVTGRIPFDADTPFAVILKHVNEPLPIPHTVNPTVPLGIERVILKALAKEPEDRYQTAAALAQDLEEGLQDLQALEWQPAFEAPASVPSATGVTQTTPLEPAPPQAQSGVSVPLPVRAAPARRSGLRWILIGAAGLVLVACCLVGAIGARRWLKARADRVAPVVEEITGTATSTPSAIATPTTLVIATPTPAGFAASPPDGVADLVQAGNEALGEECDGDAGQARTLFDQAIKQDPVAAAAYVGRARCALCAGFYDDAMSDLNEAIAQDPESAPAYYWRGRARMELASEREAEADLTKAIELDPGFVEAYYWRAQLSMWLGEESERALADATKVIELAPEFAKAYIQRAQLYCWYMDDPGAALEDLARFIELRPDDPEGYSERASVYLEYLEDYDRAIADLGTAIQYAPDDPYLLWSRAWAYYAQGAFDLAVQDLTRALEISPDVDTYFYRGVARYSAGQYESALEDLDTALLLGWDGEGAVYHVKGWAYAALGRYDEAIEAYDLAGQYDWESYAAWDFLYERPLLLDRGIAYRESGQYESALEDLTDLVREWEGWYRTYYERALTYKAMGNTAAALTDLRQAWEYAEDAEWRAKLEQEMQALGGQ